MPNVTSVTTQVNNTPSLYGQLEPITLKIPRKRIIRSEYTPAKNKQHKIADEIIKAHKLRGASKELLKFYVNNSDLEGVCRASIEANAEKIGYSREWLGKVKDSLVEKGIVSCDKNGWQETNTIIILAFQHLNINKCEETSHEYNNLTSLRDLTNKQTYDEYAFASPKAEKKDIKQTKSKHINASALNGDDPDGEVIRVCLAWLLCEKKTKYAVMRMRDRKTIGNPVKYLAIMCKGLSAGNWDISDFEKDEHQRHEEAEKRAREQIERELREEKHRLATLESEKCKARGGDVKPMAEMREILRLAALGN